MASLSCPNVHQSLFPFPFPFIHFLSFLFLSFPFLSFLFLPFPSPLLFSFPHLYLLRFHISFTLFPPRTFLHQRLKSNGVLSASGFQSIRIRSFLIPRLEVCTPKSDRLWTTQPQLTSFISARDRYFDKTFCSAKLLTSGFYIWYSNASCFQDHRRSPPVLTSRCFGGAAIIFGRKISRVLLRSSILLFLLLLLVMERSRSVTPIFLALRYIHLWY